MRKRKIRRDSVQTVVSRQDRWKYGGDQDDIVRRRRNEAHSARAAAVSFPADFGAQCWRSEFYDFVRIKHNS